MPVAIIGDKPPKHFAWHRGSADDLDPVLSVA
jgi:hypothetical protein